LVSSRDLRDKLELATHTTLDAIELSKQPVLITHSNARVLAGGHPRCKPDNVIKALDNQGGVMSISFIRNFVRGTEPTTIEHALDHFDYVSKLIGVEQVGVGTDADVDGYDDLPKEMLDGLRKIGDAKYAWRDKMDIEGLEFFDLTEGLIRRGYSDHQIEGILGGNFKRVLAKIWR
jgi:membrane dipeptidase